jgi:hypothetical protein
MVAAVLAAALVWTACVSEPDDTPVPTSTATPTATATPTDDATPTEAGTPSPTATPEPELTLALPDESDDRRVTVTWQADMPADEDGTITVSVTSAADTMITELVLRWPEELHETLFPAPFVPSSDRIRDGGPPLVQPWTKWVIGPGERGEPEGTVSLGYGPLSAGATLEIPLFVTRVAEGPVAFDLHVLAGEAILTLDDGQPAALRLEVP